MTRITLFLIGAVCASLFACTDGDPPQHPGDGTSTGGVTTATSIVTTATDTGPGSEVTGDEPPTTITSGTADPTTGEPTTTGGQETGGTTTGGTTTGDPPGPVYCGSKLWACGDGLDNDGDGKIDNADFECISPCDDDEGSFQTDIPGGNEDCKNDCFWDADSGVGTDNCQYPLTCDPQNPGAGSELNCEFKSECPADTPPECIDRCVPLVPNGCDCFGCCHIGTPDGVHDYYLDSGDGCSLANLDACNHCTFQEQCQNPCEDCEICFGQDAPQDCGGGESGGENDTDGPMQCPDGIEPCTMGGDECPVGYYCQTGCCAEIVPG